MLQLFISSTEKDKKVKHFLNLNEVILKVKIRIQKYFKNNFFSDNPDNIQNYLNYKIKIKKNVKN